MPQLLDKTWVRRDLIPFLEMVFNEGSGYKSKSSEQWEIAVKRAANHINTIRNYDDSMISIDRIRLTLLSPSKVSADGRMQVSEVIKDVELVTMIFVRRAFKYGPYPIMSLGVKESPEALRERKQLRRKGEQRQKTPQMKTKHITSRSETRQPESQSSDESYHSGLTADAPVLVQDKSIYNTRFAPIFVPGRQEHITLTMGHR